MPVKYAPVRRVVSVLAVVFFCLAGFGCQRNEVNREIGHLHDTDKEVRQEAVKALVRIGPPAVEPLIKALREKNPDVQAAAAKALGLIGDKRAVMPLVDMMKNSYNVELMFEIAVALTQIGDERACGALQTASRNSSDLISSAARKVLSQSGLCKQK